MTHHAMEGSRLLGDPRRSHSPTGEVQLHFPGSRGGILPVEQSPAPMWMHYDPYHGANYTVELPKGSPIRSRSPNPYSSGGESADEENQASDPDCGGSNIDRHRYFLQRTQTNDWRLNYHDFLPDLNRYEGDVLVCNQTFSDVMEKANSWLKQNPHIDVTSCETVVWTATSPIMVGDSETVVLDRCSCPSSETDSHHVTGLRLWFNSSRSPTSVHNNNSGPLFDSKSIGYRDYEAREDETLTTFLKRVNFALGKNWLQGSILSVNSVFIPVCPDGVTSQLVWRESQVQHSTHNLLLRIFYKRGNTEKELLGIKDIIPEPNKGNWESFSQLMRKATNWIRRETGVHIANLQSMYVTRNHHTDSAKESAELSCQSLRDCSAHQSFQLLRLYYVARRTDTNQPTSSQHEHHVINCMTFTPVQTTLGPNVEAEFERMRQTMSRISAWLELAGATIRSAETFITPVSSSSANHTLPEMTLWTPFMLKPSNSSNLQKYLMHIRIYLDGDFSDPDPQQLPPLPYSLTAALQNTIQEREYKKYYSQKKTRKRRRKITLLIFLAILLIVVGMIILDQLFDIFK